MKTLNVNINLVPQQPDFDQDPRFCGLTVHLL